VRRTVVRKNRYLDSVFLMQVARRIAAVPGIRDAAALLATEANRKVLAGLGYGDAGRDAEFAAAGPNDLLLALEGEAAAVDAVAADADAWLARPAATPGAADLAGAPRSIAEAVARRPDSRVAVISVPGRYAVREARAALGQGLHVFLFSSGVSLDDERALKNEARERGLIVMGPDCGTSYLGGAGVGFANAVRRGPIGIVGSTGTGMQEFSCLVHQAGSGISNGIGTGSRDLSDAIGGVSTFTALDALEADPLTEVIAVIAKPPGAAVCGRVVERLRRGAKPAVLCLLGVEPADLAHLAGTADPGDGPDRLRVAADIDDAVHLALGAAPAPAPPEGAAGGPGPASLEGNIDGGTVDDLRRKALEHIARMRAGQRTSKSPRSIARSSIPKSESSSAATTAVPAFPIWWRPNSPGSGRSSSCSARCTTSRPRCS